MTHITSFNLSTIAPNNVSQTSLMEAKKSSPSVDTAIQNAIESVRDKTGIVTAHLAPLQKLAHDHHCVIGIRPVDPLATELIENGHPTKDFHIKGKSASWGAQAGLICVDQGYSKLENHPERIAKFNQQTQQCIQQGHAAAVPLAISPARLMSLLQAGVISDLSRDNAQGMATFTAKAPSGKVYQCQAERRQQGGEDVYMISHQGEQIEVLAPSADKKPLTADYDLFLIGPYVSDLGPQDNLPVPDVAHGVFRKRIDGYKPEHKSENSVLMQDYRSAENFYRKEDADIGNASARIRDMIPVINHALVGNGEKVVHHNADSGSPAADPAANYPATFFLPRKIGNFEAICIISNSHELKTLVQQAKDDGYHIPLNPLWEDEVKEIRRANFGEALAFFRQGR